MTDERKPAEPGMAEVSPKFVDEAKAAVEAAASTDETLSALWQECERLRQQYGEAVKETDLAFAAEQAITETETPEYRAASRRGARLVCVAKVQLLALTRMSAYG